MKKHKLRLQLAHNTTFYMSFRQAVNGCTVSVLSACVRTAENRAFQRTTVDTKKRYNGLKLPFGVCIEIPPRGIEPLLPG